jgi:hypothetical protein
MRTRTRRLIAGALCLFSALAIAPAGRAAEYNPVLARGIQSAINQEGYACPQVTHFEGASEVSDGSWLLGAVCSDGGRYILHMTARDQLQKVTSCVWFAGKGLPFCRN